MTRVWWRPHSVRTQVVAGVCAVVSVVLIGVGIVSVLSLRSYATETNNIEVSRSLAAFSHSFAQRTEEPTIEEMTHYVGQAPGNLIAVLDGDVVVNAVVFSAGEAQSAPPELVAALREQDWADGPPRTTELGKLGSYRVQSRTVDGRQLVSGVAMDRSNHALAVLTVAVVALIVVALLITATGVVLVVSYALRPLRRVAATAAGVATMPLAGEGQRITVRVDETDTDPDNEIGVVGSTLNRLLDNVDDALVELAEADRRTKQLLTDVSHELRTPLAVIQGYAELTRQDSSDLPPNSEHALARIEAEAHRMALLVKELLLLSRLEEGQDLQTEDVDLGDLVVDAVNDAAVTAPDHRWVTRLPEEPVWVPGDRHRLHQLLTNLLANAREHNPGGVTVTTAVTVDAAGVELSVADDGPDIDPVLLSHLFDRFVQADPSRARSSGGAGLGLPIVAAIARAHRGSVAVESAGGLTVFRVRLPVLAG